MSEEFNPTGGTEQQSLNQTEQQRKTEEMTIAERLLKMDYRSSMTVVGEDLITEVKKSVEEGDFDRLESSVLKAVPLVEGLEFGVYAESYGVSETQPDLSTLSADERAEAQVKQNNVYSKLRNMFLTVEDSIDRGNIGYLRDAVLDAVSRPIRELEKWDKDGGVSWEKEKRQTLINSFDEENMGRLIRGEEVLKTEEIEQRIERVIQWARKKEEKKAEVIRDNRERLLALDLHVKSRFTFDAAFRQRQFVAHDRDLQSNMKQSVGLGAAEPDGTHWQGFYQVDRDWGEAVDKVERELVEMGIKGITLQKSDGTTEQSDGVYTGNLTTAQFKVWMDRLLDASAVEGSDKKRMDVVWAGWRQFCVKELAGKFSKKNDELVNKKNEDSGHKMMFNANPPYVGDLSSWLSYPEEHRAAEFGWNQEMLDANKKGNWDGKVRGERTKSYKAVSHSGHPKGIGRLTKTDAKTDDDQNPIANFGKHKVGNFMEFASVREIKLRRDDDGNYRMGKFYDLNDRPVVKITERDSDRFDKLGNYRDEITVERNLWQLWWENGISQADINFPYADTDLIATGRSEEIAGGAVGYWFLQRGRALSVLKDVLGIPDHRSLSSITAEEKLRNWDKLGMIKPGGFYNNPIYVKIRSEIAFFNGLTPGNLKSLRNKGEGNELELSTISAQESIGPGTIGENNKGVSTREYALHCLEFGLISYKEYQALDGIRRHQ